MCGAGVKDRGCMNHIQFDSKPFYEILVDVKHDNGTFQTKWFTKETDRCQDKEKADQIKKLKSRNRYYSIVNKEKNKRKSTSLYDLTIAKRGKSTV